MLEEPLHTMFYNYSSGIDRARQESWHVLHGEPSCLFSGANLRQFRPWETRGTKHASQATSSETMVSAASLSKQVVREACYRISSEKKKEEESFKKAADGFLPFFLLV